MKPAFALDFRDNAVSLLHRSGSGWHQVGSVPLDEPDLPTAIGYLRSTALGLSPQGLATKLVIPNDQILYLPVVAPGPDAATRRSQIAVALEGRTPYPVEDLVFDWSGKGPEVQVAVIARETLAEAEAFAAEHRFNPMSFVAVPEDGTFRGEPWFGPTEMSARLLAPGEKLEKDSQPVALRSRKIVAEPAPQPHPEPVPEPVAEVVVEVAPEPVFEPAPVVEPMLEPEVPAAGPIPEPVAAAIWAEAPAPEAPAFDETPDVAEDIAFHIAAAEEPAPEPEASNAGFDAPAFEPASAPPPRMAPATPPPADPIPTPVVMEPEDLLRADPDMHAEPAPAAAPPVIPLTARSATRLPDEAPMALDVTDEDPLAEDPRTFPDEAPGAAPKPVSVVDPAISDNVPPMPAWTPAMAFASRRSSEAAGKGKPLPAAPSGKPGLRAPVERPAGAKPLSAPPPRPAALAERPGVKDPKSSRGIGALMGSDKDGKKRKAVAAPPPMAKPAAAQPAKPATPSPQAARQGSIGLGGRPAPQRGKPKYLGLILTVILLVFLAAVAAWSTLLASWDGETTGVETATTADPAAPDTGSETPAPEDEMLADMQDPADYAEDGAAEPVAEAAPEAAPAEAAPDTAVATEAATAGTPSEDQQDEIFLATMDAPPDAPDPLALPQTTAQGDSLPDTQAAPPPFGTVYQFDANGLIIPTKDGIVTPDGVRLVAGKPAREPPARPAELTAAAAPAAADATTESAPAADAPFPSDPALAGARPKLRPEGLVTPASASPDDDASLAPAADSRFASLRPRARPEAVVAAGEAARLASAGASLAENAVASPADAAISPLAVSISRKPAARPQDMSRAVEAAVAAATREPPPQPEPEPKPEPAAKPTKAASKTAPPPDDQLADDEPEHNGAAPSIPTKASVAKQATYKNAINLSKLNLIGVYGTQSNRYALIRQENGRYKKVKVGDKIDGGKVAAITASELRYQKGSRMVTLSLPAG